ncbi:segregation/condensation protein A [Brevibacterium daeguense]
MSEVTDEFLAYVSALRGRTELDELSNFLLVAATLLDLKTARLLPSGEVEDEVDLELLEARDLLFARLLQYRAYKSVSAVFAARMTETATAVARSVPLEPQFAEALPPLIMTATPEVLAALFATVLQRDHTPPTVSLEHLHLPQVSVPEQRSLILSRLRADAAIDFTALVADAENTLVVVGRFLALLELFKAGLCRLEQSEPLGILLVSGTDRAAAGRPGGSAPVGLDTADHWEAADG